MPTVNELEQQKAKLQDYITKRDLALKLSNNRDFRKLIMDEYFTQEAARLVGLSADPVLSDRERADALSMAQATGHLKRWLVVLCQMGDRAEQDIAEIDMTLDEVRGEEIADEDDDHMEVMN